jgi:hypothetical protein
MQKMCVLDEERPCVDCGECLVCDLDPEKHCDNCMRCIKKSGADYLAVEIDEVINAADPDAGDAPSTRAEDRKAPRMRAIRARKPRRAPTVDLGEHF